MGILQRLTVAVREVDMPALQRILKDHPNIESHLAQGLITWCVQYHQREILKILAGYLKLKNLPAWHAMNTCLAFGRYFDIFANYQRPYLVVTYLNERQTWKQISVLRSKVRIETRS